jgi:hypothetical protein
MRQGSKPAVVAILCVLVMMGALVTGCGEKEGPAISSILPSSGDSGMVVTVTGSGFQDKEATNWVDFGTATADALEWSDTEIKVKVPSGVDAGEYEVTVTTDVGTSQGVKFDITEVEN